MKKQTLKDKRNVFKYYTLYEEEDVKQFIKEILDEIDKNVDASDNGYSINTEIVKKIIKQESGFEELE